MSVINEFGEFLLKDDLVGADWIGIVVDNKDPEFTGRCKVRIYGKFDGTGCTRALFKSSE